MKPIYKFNNGNGATLCHLCRTIITVGKPTNDLYCDRCLSERIKTREEFKTIIENSKQIKEFYEQIKKEVHFNRGNMNM